MGPTPKISEAIIEVLKRQDKPIKIDEIAFRTRTSRSAINDVLNRLRKAGIVIENEETYRLNNQGNYDFSEAYK